MEHTAEEPVLLTIPETAAQLRVSRTTVYRLINEGHLATVDISRVPGHTRTRVSRAAITRYVKDRERQAS